MAFRILCGVLFGFGLAFCIMGLVATVADWAWNASQWLGIGNGLILICCALLLFSLALRGPGRQHRPGPVA